MDRPEPAQEAVKPAAGTETASPNTKMHWISRAAAGRANFVPASSWPPGARWAGKDGQPAVDSFPDREQLPSDILCALLAQVVRDCPALLDPRDLPHAMRDVPDAELHDLLSEVLDEGRIPDYRLSRLSAVQRDSLPAYLCEPPPKGGSPPQPSRFRDLVDGLVWSDTGKLTERQLSGVTRILGAPHERLSVDPEPYWDGTVRN